MSYHTGGMRTTMGRTMNGRTTTSRRTAGRRAPVRRTTPRATTPRTGRMMNGNGRMMNGTGARGARRMTGPMGRGGVRRARTQRPAPVMRRGRTTSTMMNRTAARGRVNRGTGSEFGRIDGFGNNI